MLDLIEKMHRGEIPPPPVATLIGFALTAIEPGRAVIELTAEARHANPMGTLHGGILCDVADAAMGMAYASALEEGETFTTLELKINFLKPVWTGTLVAVGRVVKAGGDGRARRVRRRRRQGPPGGAGNLHLHDAPGRPGPGPLDRVRPRRRIAA